MKLTNRRANLMTNSELPLTTVRKRLMKAKLSKTIRSHTIISLIFPSQGAKNAKEMESAVVLFLSIKDDAVILRGHDFAFCYTIDLAVLP